MHTAKARSGSGPTSHGKPRLSYPDPETGRIQSISLYDKTAEAVRAKLDEARERIKANAPAQDSPQRLSEWLTHWSATSLEASSRKLATKTLYRNLSRKHLEPAPLGTVRLDRLRKSHVEDLIVRLRAQGLSGSTVRAVYTVLRAALDDAVLDGLMARNPATLVKRPKVERREAKHLDAGTVAAVLKAGEGLRYRPVLVFIAATGMRRGEALALRWDAINVDEGTLRVTATINRVGGALDISEPKSERSRRTVPLSPAFVALLKAQRAAQASERLKVGDRWTDSGLVFTTELGTPVEPRNVLRTIETAPLTCVVAGGAGC